jgi:tRNA(Ile)-lysidine synthase TilS/MesJ
MKLVYNDRVATYTYDDQEVSISLPDGTIGVAVSGGLDSAALAYLICRLYY